MRTHSRAKRSKITFSTPILSGCLSVVIVGAVLFWGTGIDALASPGDKVSRQI